MNILTLPQEMLASVLKYVKIEPLIEIRKISTRIDSTAKVFKLPVIKFQQLSIHFVDGEFQAALMPKSKTFSQYQVIRKTHKKESLASILEFYFAKIHRLNTLFVQGDGRNAEPCSITTEAADIILRQRSKRINYLGFLDCEMKFSPELLRRIITTLSLQNLYLRLYINNKSFSPYKDEVYEGLQFKILLLEPVDNSFTSDITLNGIQEMCSRKLPRLLRLYKLKADIYELERFLEKFHESFDTVNIGWTFEIQLANMNFDEAAVNIRSLNCLKRFTSKCIPIGPMQGTIMFYHPQNNLTHEFLTISFTI